MAGEKRQFSFSNSGTTGAVARLLILAGIVFQLGELGYGHLSDANLWLASVVLQGAWNLLALRSYATELHRLLQYWPSLMVSIGLAILLVTRRAKSTQTVSVTNQGDDRGL